MRIASRCACPWSWMRHPFSSNNETEILLRRDIRWSCKAAAYACKPNIPSMGSSESTGQTWRLRRAAKALFLSREPISLSTFYMYSMYMVKFENPIRDCGMERPSNLFHFMCSISVENLSLSDMIPRGLVLSFSSLCDCMLGTIAAAVRVNFEKRRWPTTTTSLTIQTWCDLVTYQHTV